MSGYKFAVVLNLSNFFSDHRHRARICVNDNIKTVGDLQDKITNVFSIENFILTSRNEYLPHTEDINILQSDDIIWVIPSDVSHPNVDNVSNTPMHVSKKIVRKRKSINLNNSEDISLIKNQDELKIKKRKKKHNIDNEDEKINEKVKKHKKKHKDSKEKCPEKSEIVPKVIDCPVKTDSSVKNTSLPIGSKYVDLNPSVNVATSLPQSIPCKKAILVAPNTDKYLKKNKINIVKIDYIRRPTLELQQIENEAPPEATTTPMDVANGASLLDKESVTSSIPEISVSNNENSSKPEVLDLLPNQKPKTKYFFIDTPSEKNRVKSKPNKKRGNFFIKEGLFSPITDKNNTESNAVDVKTCDLEQVDVDKSETMQETNTISPSQTPIDYSSTSLKVSGTKPVESEEAGSPINKSNDYLYDQGNIGETKVCDVKNDIENKTDERNEISSSRNTELLSDMSKSVLQDSCYIDKISPCDVTLPDNSVINYSTSPSISGIVPFSFTSSTKKYVSGVGHLLTKLRESESKSIVDTTDNGDTSEFVTKRRHRTRKRQKKSKNNDMVDKPITPQPSPQLAGSIKSLAAPKMHIKFSDDDNQDQSQDICHENSSPVIEQNGNGIYSETSNSYHKNDREEICAVYIGSKSKETSEEDIQKAPLMYQISPKIGNVISFKVLKISEDFTPEISPYIVGKVQHYFPEIKRVTFKIISGIEQFKIPKGKFSLDEEGDLDSLSDTKELLWSELLEPRLLHPSA
ncbi:coilin [Diorhabda carinulata]|uniref:coilin n=1 Tax=Diorhabda carinulata TaxID=1163345 RepID=UPI0025A13766|nr:coilin [Diorhabda carinulata]